MLPLCCIDILVFLKDYSLVVVAIITLLGVGYTATLSYCSNIKANKSKIFIEENKMKYTFIKERFDALIIISGKLKKRRSSTSLGTDLRSQMVITFNIYNEEDDIYSSILPFIEHDKIEEINKKPNESLHLRFSLLFKISTNKEFDAEDMKEIPLLAKNRSSLRDEYIKIVDNELIVLGKKLRDFKMGKVGIITRVFNWIGSTIKKCCSRKNKES